MHVCFSSFSLVCGISIDHSCLCVSLVCGISIDQSCMFVSLVCGIFLGVNSRLIRVISVDHACMFYICRGEELILHGELDKWVPMS